MYCDIRGKIVSYLNKILQEFLFPQSVIILITLFCIRKILYTVTRISPKYYSVTHDSMKKTVIYH